MTIVIMKFGGSCLVDEKAFQTILQISKIYEDKKKIYVASALNKVTDLLLVTAQNVDNSILLDNNMAIIEKMHFDIIEQIFEEDSEHYNSVKKWIDEKLSDLEDIFSDIREFGLEPYYQDLVLSYGETLSTYILYEFLLSKGLDSVFIPSKDIIITNDEFNNAYPLYAWTNPRIERSVIPLLENQKKNIIICITGFIGRNKIGNITTLGRGGSDYTATILAHSIYEVGNDKDISVILWKDVSGLLAINPKYIPNSALIRNLDYDEAKHVANFGAKVLHPKCLEAIEKHLIPLEIRNFDNPLEKLNYTLISEHSDRKEIKGISAEENATIITIASGTLVDVPGVLAKMFKVMSKKNISVSLVAQSASEISTSFIINTEDTDIALKALRDSEFFSDFFEIKHEEVAILNITGAKVLENLTKVSIFKALDEKDIHVKAITQGTEELNLSLVLKREDLTSAVNLIHKHLCENSETGFCKE
jgi:bifunctional aspartokinase / homoserine dehydrogenase 1